MTAIYRTSLSDRLNYGLQISSKYTSINETLFDLEMMNSTSKIN